MPLAMQSKLLRFLENRRFMRVGGTTKIQADVRLIFATLRPLEEDVRSGRFRADLYYRIQGITLAVPPLRSRRADIPLLVEQFAAQLSARHGTAQPRLTRGARALLSAYSWPGNVRELRNVIEMVCLLREGRMVRVRDLPEALQRSPSDASQAPTEELRLSLKQPLDAMVEEIIEAVIAAEGGNRTRAAERLGISVRTIQRHAGRTQPARSRRGSGGARDASRQRVRRGTQRKAAASITR
jgi:DNA-binding NtrC family response regulator